MGYFVCMILIIAFAVLMACMMANDGKQDALRAYHVQAVKENLDAMLPQLDDDTEYFDAMYHLNQIDGKHPRKVQTKDDVYDLLSAYGVGCTDALAGRLLEMILDKH